MGTNKSLKVSQGRNYPPDHCRQIIRCDRPMCDALRKDGRRMCPNHLEGRDREQKSSDGRYHRQQGANTKQKQDEAERSRTKTFNEPT